MDAELRKLLRRMQPSLKNDEDRLTAILERHGVTGKDWERRVKAAQNSDNARWIEGNPAFDDLLNDMEARLKRSLSATDLSEVEVKDIAKAWNDDARMSEAILKVWFPNGKELRDRDLMPEDLIRIALRRARGDRWELKEAADD